MIDDPDIAQAIEIYFACGGIIHRIPAGMSGTHCMWTQAAARSFAFTGWARRHDAQRLPPDAISCLSAGLLTIAQAQAPQAWNAAVALGRRAATVRAIADRIGAPRPITRRTLDLLEAKGYLQRDPNKRAATFQAIGDRTPDWREFLPRLGLAFAPEIRCVSPALQGPHRVARRSAATITA